MGFMMASLGFIRRDVIRFYFGIIGVSCVFIWGLRSMRCSSAPCAWIRVAGSGLRASGL